MVVGDIVEDAGVGAGGDDGPVGRRLAALAAEFVNQVGFEFVFVAASGRSLHRPPVGVDRDGCRATHQRQFVAILDQAHVIQGGTQIVDHRRCTLAGPTLRPHGSECRGDTVVAVGIETDRMPQRRLVGEQFGQRFIELVDGACLVEAESFACRFGAVTVAVPDLPVGIARPAKQDRLRLVAGNQDQRRLGFREAGQVLKIAVGAIGIRVVAVAQPFRRADVDPAATVPLAGNAACVDRLRQQWRQLGPLAGSDRRKQLRPIDADAGEGQALAVVGDAIAVEGKVALPVMRRVVDQNEMGEIAAA